MNKMFSDFPDFLKKSAIITDHNIQKFIYYLYVQLHIIKSKISTTVAIKKENHKMISIRESKYYR